MSIVLTYCFSLELTNHKLRFHVGQTMCIKLSVWTHRVGRSISDSCLFNNGNIATKPLRFLSDYVCIRVLHQIARRIRNRNQRGVSLALNGTNKGGGC